MGATASVSFNAMTGRAERPQPARTTRSCLVRLTRAHNKFAFRLHGDLAAAARKTDNVLACPLGVSLGLGMLVLGAKGTTREQLTSLYNIDDVEETQQLPAFAAVHWDATRSTLSKGCRFEFALGMFAQRGHEMIGEYEEMCSIYELTPLRHADFTRCLDDAFTQISEWVEERTRRHFTRALTTSAILAASDQRTPKLLAVNAAYVRVRWLKHFDASQTTDAAFHVSPSSGKHQQQVLTVRLMHRKDVFRWGTLKKPACSVLELPFANGHMKMYILLPPKPGGLDKLEKGLARANVDDVIKCLADVTVDVYLPHFTSEVNGSLRDALQRANVKDVFIEAKADLSGIDGTGELYLATFHQCVCVCVDEGVEEANPGPSERQYGNGTVKDGNATGGGANSNVTDGTAASSMADQQSKTFRVDRPFLFFIFDDRTEAILIVGRVVKPT